MKEHFFQCPYCWETISMLIDISVKNQQEYIEDCEVCCNPIHLNIQIDNDEVFSVIASNIEE